MLKIVKKLIFGLFMIAFGFDFIFAAVSKDYYPNYKIQDNWNNIIEMLVKVEAYKGTSSDIPTSIFKDLNKSFNAVFPYFPKTPNNKIVYELCKLSSADLSKQYKYEKFLVFRDKCYDPLNKIIKEINSSYRVKADIKVNPKSGSAPLTVTFDARGSVDPSNDTIPEGNYYWYYKDNSGTQRSIGKGPILSYTFNDAGMYVIHLTVRSVNLSEKGVFDGEATVNVDVGPKSAVMSVYANGKKLDEKYTAKVGTQEASKGVMIDGSGTYPTGGRKIKSHEWSIYGAESFSYKKGFTGNPGAINVVLPSKGEYNVDLKVEDNENNKIVATYKLIVSDPIATIKFAPEVGSTTSTYSFDAGLSYSIQSRIKTYKWTIFDPNGNKLDTFETKNFQKTFLKPGNYTVKLTVNDELGNTNDDQIKFYVDSTPPDPQFKITPVVKRQYASQFVLDASSSSDIDVMNGNDTLKFDRRFSNAGNVKIEKKYDNGKKILVSFNEKGDYKVRLQVSDNYGKVSEIEKEIKVESSLRPQLMVNPVATVWGSKTSFSIDSNKSLSYYEWDFGDGTSSKGESKQIVHQYEKIGVFDVAVKVKTPSGESNTVYGSVFVGQKGYPITAYTVSDNGETSLSAREICVEKTESGTIDHKAFGIDRYQTFVINTDRSVNSKGEKTDLNIYYKPKNDESYNTKNLSYKFSELGCDYIDLYIEDTTINKTNSTRIRFKVKNSLPTLGNLGLFFPQYGNESGIGMKQNQSQDITASDFDPLITKVQVNQPADKDGYISYFQWYYYKTDDPTRLLEVKITPYNTPYAFFSIPKVPGEFTFGVKIVDNDGGEITSEEIIGRGPVLFFPANAANPDIPIVTLRTKPINAKVGEDVQFTIIAKILSSRTDFKSNRIIKIDFEGDGKYDVTTKKDTITYVYTKPGKYKPTVKVVYRGYAGIARGETIEVTKGLKTTLLADTYDKHVLLRDLTYGEIEEKQYCLELGKCTEDNKALVKNKDYFDYEFEDYGKKVLKLTVNDKYGNVAYSPKTIDLSKPDTLETFHLLSLPNVTTVSGSKVIQVGNSLDNSILIKGIYNGSGNCFIDFDVSKDSDNDGNPQGDKDASCNTIKLNKYFSGSRSTFMSVNYDKDGKTVQEDIKIEFIDNDAQIPKEYEAVYDKIDSIISAISVENNESASFLKTMLINLKNSLGDKLEMDSLIVQLQDWLDNNPGVVSPEIENDIKGVIEKLADKSVKAAFGGNEYEIAKTDILIFFPDAYKDEIKGYFTEIENSNGNMDLVKQKAQKILDVAVELVKKGTIDETDLKIIKNDICKIFKYYNIQSDKCGQQETKTTTTSGGTTLSKVLKIIGIVAGVLVVLFIILTVIFAIKAKKQQAAEQNDPNSMG